MLTGLSIRTRLAAWYFLSVAAVLATVAVGSYFAMRASMLRAIDQSLMYQLNGLQEFLGAQGGLTREQLQGELNRGASLTLAGGLFQVFDSSGALMYQSPGLARHAIAATAPLASGQQTAFRNAGTMGWPLRLASRRIAVNGAPVAIEVAEALRSYESSLRAYARWLLLFSPALALIAGGLGYWMSGRALAPVDRIIADAEAIGTDNLSERLSVPPAHDELRHLSETLNAMLERIEGSVSRITQFTADASHELRAPLTLIQVAAEHALRRERSREELVESLTTVLREAKRTACLVDDLLLLARADARSDAVSTVPTELTAVLREVADRARGLADAKGVAFTSEIGDAPVIVTGDSALLQRLALILVDNAIKYTPENGQVRLALHARRDQAVIEVTDTGVGIDPEDLPRVFDRFWRADKARSRSLGGAGLGLSIAKWIVDRGGGTLTVESEPGRGSIFRATFPVLVDGAASPFSEP